LSLLIHYFHWEAVFVAPPVKYRDGFDGGVSNTVVAVIIT